MGNDITDIQYKKVRDRIAWIDMLRVMAISSVLLVHILGTLFNILNLEYVLHLSEIEQGLLFFFHIVGRLGVPLFLMISGYLLLDKEYTYNRSMHFYKCNLLNLFISTEIWIVIYNLIMCFYAKESIDLFRLLKEMLFFKYTSINHLWYLPMIIGLYLFIPIISTMLKNIELRLLLIPYIVSIFFVFCVPIANILFLCLGKTSLKYIIDLDFSGGVYGIYLIMGYLLKKDILKKIKMKYLVLCSSSAIVLLIFLIKCAYEHGIVYDLWYDNCLLFIIAICIFEMISRMHIQNNIVLETISRMSFGIYLVHNTFIIFLSNVINIDIIQIKFICLYIITFVGSLLLVYLISRNKNLGLWLFYIK